VNLPSIKKSRLDHTMPISQPNLIDLQPFTAPKSIAEFTAVPTVLSTTIIRGSLSLTYRI